MNATQAFEVGQAVNVRWTISDEPRAGVIERRELVETYPGVIWMAASQYFVRRQDGALLNYDLIDAHKTAGGMVQPA